MSTDYAPNSKANEVLTEEHQLLLGAHGTFYITGLFVCLSRFCSWVATAKWKLLLEGGTEA